MAALQLFGLGALGLTAADFHPDSVVQLGHPPRRIDLLTAIDGVSFDDCWPRRQVLSIDGVEVNLISLEDFAANKRAAGRLKDLADLESLGLLPRQAPPSAGG